MNSKPRKSPVQQRKPVDERGTEIIVEVIPDVFTDLWIRYGDGSWQWVDLTLLAETKAFQKLRDSTFFRRARISRNQLAVEWAGGVRLSRKQLVGAPNELNTENVFMRAASDTAFGWYRPLMVSVPRWLERRHLPGEIREMKLSDTEALEWLGFPKAQLQRVLAAYPGEEKVIMARLLDLVMYLTQPTRSGVITFRQWLTHRWGISRYPTPEEAIENGQIAYVERLFTGKTDLIQNFTICQRENFTGKKS